MPWHTSVSRSGAKNFGEVGGPTPVKITHLTFLWDSLSPCADWIRREVRKSKWQRKGGYSSETIQKKLDDGLWSLVRIQFTVQGRDTPVPA